MNYFRTDAHTGSLTMRVSFYILSIFCEYDQYEDKRQILGCPLLTQNYFHCIAIICEPGVTLQY